MNERIQELLEQAEQYALDKANEGNDEDYEYSFDDDFQEKFAELIVQECVEINKQELAFNAFERLMNKYKEHFGVEE